MAKYFMSGTKYEKFERMMMPPPTHVRSDDEPKENKGRNFIKIPRRCLLL